MSFDLALHNFSEAAEQGYTFDLLLPTGAESGAKLSILGDMSPTVENYMKKAHKEFSRLTKAASGKNKEVELEEYAELSLNSALVRLIGWEGVTENGKDVPFSKEKAAEFLKVHRWAQQMIINEAGQVENFTPKTLKG